MRYNRGDYKGVPNQGELSQRSGDGSSATMGEVGSARRASGSLEPLILGPERARIWVFDRFNPGLISCQNQLADGHKSFIPKGLDCVP